VKALVCLVPRLTNEACQQATLKAMRTIEFMEPWLEALAAFGPLMPEEQLRQELMTTPAIKDERYRANALAALAPHLTGDLLRQALQVALGLETERRRAEVLTILAPKLTGELSAQALEAACAFQDDEKRADVLIALLPQLTGKAREQALQQGLSAVLAKSRGDKRHETYVALLAPFRSDLKAVSKQIRQTLSELFWGNFRHWERREFLSFCADSQIFVPPILDGNTLSTIAEHIHTIRTQWQWP
jgi:hypothetical protein